MTSFLDEPEATAPVQALYDADLGGDGFVMNLTRTWAHDPDALEQLRALFNHVSRDLTFRQKGVLISATASTLGDSYCSLAWGKRLAGEVGGEAAAGVLLGDDRALDPADQALAIWARRVTENPNGTTAADVDSLRTAGFGDAQILAITAFVALRGAFSTVNDALGVLPDREVADAAPAEIRTAVTWGRTPA